MTDNSEAEKIKRLIAVSPSGTFKIYRGSGAGIDESISTHMSNYAGIQERIQHAFNMGCYIEILSLRLQIIDFWLRIFFINRAPEGQQRQREFGRLLNQCRNLGLDPSLFSRLKNFNNHRVKAIHGYIVGHTTYQALETVVRESRDLSTDLIIFVLTNCGSVITNLEDTFNVGDMIINLPVTITQIEAKRDLA